LRIERTIHVGDEDDFREETIRTEREWYVPEIGASVKQMVWEEPGAALFGTSSPPSGRIGDRFLYEMVSQKKGH
jgi:hypothetical protein